MKIVYDGSMDPRLCKSVLGETIPALAAEDPDFIYLDADLMNCIGTAKWAAANPDRAINCGIAEANMIGVACGLAAAGFKPMVNTFGPFASRRCYDQLFLSAGYAKNDITVIGTDPGVTAAMNGGTHMPFEDMALYRAIPGATVIDVTDPTMLISVLRQCKDRPGVKYIRVGRKSYAKVYAEGSELPIGKAVTLREGTDVVIFACGILVHEAMQAAKRLQAERWEHPDLVFTGENGKYINPAKFSSDFCNIRRKLGIKTTFHMLRHDMASRMKASGQFDFKDIQEQLGHSTIQITMDIYTHIDEEAKAAVSHWLDGDAENIVSLGQEKNKRQIR